MRPSSDTPPPRLLLFVGLLALVVRLLHNQSLLADPLYYNPLGGNVPYLLMAEEIAAGDLLPLSDAFTLNSPLYPYLLAGIYKVVGPGSLYAVRLVTSVLDAGTCVLVALLAFRHAGVVAGWAAGLAMAVYGPLVFFATDLTPVPFTLFFLTLAVVLLDVGAPDAGAVARGRASSRADPPEDRAVPPARDDSSLALTFAAAGLLLGLATATRPNVLLAGLLALAVPFARRLRRPRRLATAVALGLALGVAPVTLANLAASGDVVLLTRSAGHNLYIGHNPVAQGQYTLPTALDGDIFSSMKGLAESVEGRSLAPGEVSPWYLRRALAHAVQNPGRELELLGRRALLLVNDFEATTYSSYEYQAHYSGVLRFAPGLAVLLLLAAPGALLFVRREQLHLWIPVLTAALTVLAFFYIARLRILMVPSLGVFAGAAVARGVSLAREKARSAVAGAAIVGLVAAGVSSLPVLRADTSNEWNKAGGVLRALERYPEAEAALERARVANPDNPNTYRNLVVLYRETGRPEAAQRAEARAREIMGRRAGEAERFRRALEGGV